MLDLGHGHFVYHDTFKALVHPPRRSYNSDFCPLEYSCNVCLSFEALLGALNNVQKDAVSNIEA